MSDPTLDAYEKSLLVKQLMDARRAVKDAKSARDRDAEAKAHHVVDEAKRALGAWSGLWNDGSPDLNRQAVKNSPYADWYSRLRRG